MLFPHLLTISFFSCCLAQESHELLSQQGTTALSEMNRPDSEENIFVGKIRSLLRDLKESRTKNKKLTLEMSNFRKDMKEYIKRNDEKISEIQASVSICRNDVRDLEDDIRKVNTTVINSEEDIVKLNINMLASEDRITEVQSSVTQLSEDLTDAVEEGQSQAALITNMQENVDKNQENISNVQESVNSLKEDLTDLKGNVVRVVAEVESWGDNVESFAQSVSNVNNTVERNSAQITDVSEDMSSMTSSNQKQEILINNNMQRLNNLSKRAQWCGFQNEWSSEQSVVNYDKISYSNTNMNIAGTPLDIKSGLFTVPLTGTWRVHFSARSNLENEKTNIAIIYHNEKEVVETYHHTYAGKDPVSSTGGREVTLDASAGDTISLRTRQFGNKFYRILICFEYKAV